TLWDELHARVGANARMVSSVESVLREKDAELVIVDPGMVFTREAVQKLVGWARGGQVLVLPRSTLYSESARAELEKLLAPTRAMDISLGVSYRVHGLDDGKVVLYELPEGMVSMQGESLSAWQNFLGAVLSIPGIQPF